MKTLLQETYQAFKIHILVWTLFITYESLVIGLMSGVFGHPLAYAGHYLLSITLFYVHSNLVLKWGLKGRLNAFWRTPLILGGEIASYILLSFVLDLALINSGISTVQGHFALTTDYALRILYRATLFIGFGTGYYFLKNFYQERERTNQLEKQQLQEIIDRQAMEQKLAKAENDSLKAQINPHFLFNTLDFIYHNVLTLSPVAANTIISLSNMMRFAIDTGKRGNCVLLADEIEQVHHYRQLVQLRKKGPLYFRFTTDIPGNRNLYIIPLVLLTLVENIFKHADLCDAAQPASLSIKVKNEQLCIDTINAVSDFHEPKASGGSGLNNIQQRLKYAYGQYGYTFLQTSDRTSFRISITIPADLLTDQRASSDNGTSIGREYLHARADSLRTAG
jgi:sensor histidine kinase YesM